MEDTISRQAAIIQLSHNKNKGDDEWELAVESDIQTIWKLPSAQPDIVRCKECRYYNSEEKECLDLFGHGRRWEEDDFCSYAER